MPQIAVPFPSLFYLPDWLFVLFPFNSALALSMIFHQTLAAAAMFLMLRSFKLSDLGCVAGALIYSLSGYMFGLSSNHSLVAGAAWFPACFYLLREIVFSENIRQKYWFTIGASISILMLIASGRPEIFVPGLAITAIANLYSIVRGDSTDKRDNLIWLFRAFFFGFVFSLPIILPMAEWLAVSRRALGLLSPEVFLYSGNWYDLLSAIIGPCLGDTRLHGNTFRPLVSFSNLPAYVACAYIGPVALALAFWGFLDKQWNKRSRVCLLALLLVSLAAVLGDTTPISPGVVHYFPAAGFVRFPIKLIFISIWCIAIAAAYGTDAIKRKAVSYSVPACLAGLCGLWAACLIFASTSDCLIYIFPFVETSKTLMIKAQEAIGWALLATAGYFLAISIPAGSLKLPGDKHAAALVGLLASFLVINTFSFELKFAGKDHFEKPSYVATKLPNRHGRTLNLTYERLTVPPEFKSNGLAGAINEVQYFRQILRPNTNSDSYITEAFGFEGSMSGEYYHVFFDSYFRSSQSIRPEVLPPSDFPLSRFCAISSTNFVTTQIYRENKKWEAVKLLPSSIFTLVFEDFSKNIRVYSLDKKLPRCYLSHNWKSAASHNEVLSAIVSPLEPGWNPWLSTYIEGATQPLQQVSPPEEVSIEQKSPEIIEIHTTTKAPAYLVLCDQAYSGWKAYVDKKETQILKANAFNRAVFLPPGDHSIIFQYQPESLKLGLALASIGLLLALYLGFRVYKTKI